MDAARRRRLVASVTLGTLLNPLNSSMVAIALIRLQHDFGVTVAAATWLVSGFYLASAVAQPLAGRLADRLGPRRVYLTGLAVVMAVCAAAPLAPGFAWLVGVRVLQAFGSSVAFPAGLAMIRASSPTGRAPAASLGAVNVANSTSAALGPTLAGLLIALADWPAIFLVNVPITAVGLVAGLRWMPPDRPAASGPGDLLRTVDLAGLALFGGTLGGLLALLLELPEAWPLLPLPAAGGALLLWWERRARTPFLDVRMLAASPRLLGIYLRFAGINLVFYTIFLAMPLWLLQARGLASYEAGLLLLPVAGLGVVVTPVAAWSIGRSGPRPTLVLGGLSLLVGTVLLLLFGPVTPLWAIVAAGTVLGASGGLNTLGLQSALYEAAPPEVMGAAAGLFQTCRYVGAILSGAVIGLAFAGGISSAGLHVLAALLAVLSGVLLVASVASLRRAG